jgi:methyl-accepting chemotaxis protein
MKIKLKLRHKIQLIIISISVVIFLGAIGYISIKAKNASYSNAVKLVEAKSKFNAKKVQELINEDFAVIRTLSHAFKEYKFLPKDRWQKLVNNIYDEVFKANPSFYQLWDSWELQYIDTAYNKPYGRIMNTRFREDGVVKSTSELRSMNGDPELYARDKARAEELISELYADVYSTGKQEKKYMTSLESPIIKDGDFIGLVGVDITLDRFQEIVKGIELENLKSHAFLLSHNGKYAGHPNSELLNKPAEKNPTSKESFDLFEKIKTGKQFSIKHKKEDEAESFVSYSPIKIGRTETYWYLGVAVPTQSIMDRANENFKISLLVGLIGLIILSTVIYIVARNITIPIDKVTSVLNRVSKGHIDKDMKLEISSGDEIEEMATALNTSIEELNKKNEFAKSLGDGNLDHEFQLSHEEDELGNSLLEMRDSLKKAREEEKQRKEEDERRQWVNEGLTKFADILRKDNDDLQKLSDNIIKKLVKYLGANQGGLFILNDEDEENVVYELQTAFAYDRKKYKQKTFKPGESLVGTCALEKEKIYLTELPQDYIEITSGLGDANPDSLLIVPLKNEEEVLGVIEIASFRELAQHEIDFVEKVAENIASTLASVKVNLKTNQLLEKSQQQAEELSSQEEEMRQNMEELQATQEEAARKKAEMEGLVNALNESSYVIEYDLDGKILTINDNYLDLLGVSREYAVGSHHSDHMDFTEEQKKEYEKFWNDLKSGKIKKQTNIVKINKKTHKFTETYTPIKDANGNIVKILKIANNISDFEENS